MQLLRFVLVFNLAVIFVNTLKMHHKMTYTEILRNYYHDDAQLDQIINNITNDEKTDSSSTISFIKNKCENDTTYPYIVIENSKEPNPLEVIITCNIHAR